MVSACQEIDLPSVDCWFLEIHGPGLNTSPPTFGMGRTLWLILYVQQKLSGTRW